jgi:hypothetical protein
VGAEAVVAAVDGGAARTCRHARLAQHGHSPTLGKGVLQGAQLGVDAPDRLELGEYERVVAAAEPVQVEDEPAEVAIGQLARLAQEAHAPAHSSALTEPGRAAWRLGRFAVDLGLAVRRLGPMARGVLCRRRLRDAGGVCRRTGGLRVVH